MFGRLTDEAVRQYQREHGLQADGIVGPATLARLLADEPKGMLGMKTSRRRIDEIIVHCTATPAGKDYTAADIRRWHTTPVSKGGRGWSDIGYHYVVRLDGTIETGRDVDVAGAHCEGHNSHSIGVVYVGGLAPDAKTPADTRTEAQKDALLRLLLMLRAVYPRVPIHGHRDYSTKACPSFDATTEYRSL